MATIHNYDAYITTHLKEKSDFILEMESYAAENHVPIMGNIAIENFLGLLSLQNPKNFLEIGSAIGYSAIRIAETFPEVQITTIERNAERFDKAVEYIAESDVAEQIQIIQADALELEESRLAKEPYDALFIDAAKGQYQRFFEKYAPFVKGGGVIYCDNMFMHGMVLQEDRDIPRRKRTMIRNLRKFMAWIMSNPNYDASLLPIGDGILIAIKKET